MRAMLLAALLAVGISAPCGGAPPGQGSVPAQIDTTAVTVVRSREAEPVIAVAERKSPRKSVQPAPDQRWMRIMIDLLLGSVAFFTVYAFLKLRNVSCEYEAEPEFGKDYGEEPASSSLDERKGEAVLEMSPEPGETAESLRSRRKVCTCEIERLMKRL